MHIIFCEFNGVGGMQAMCISSAGDKLRALKENVKDSLRINRKDIRFIKAALTNKLTVVKYLTAMIFLTG